jgi:hypothetical protein
MHSRKSMRPLLGGLLILMTSTSALAELCTVGRDTEVRWKGEWYKARITEASPDQCKVTYAGYSSTDDEWVGPGRMRIKVLWKGEWYPAHVIRKDGDRYLVHYQGYTNQDNEAVPLSRIQVR